MPPANCRTEPREGRKETSRRRGTGQGDDVITGTRGRPFSGRHVPVAGRLLPFLPVFSSHSGAHAPTGDSDPVGARLGNHGWQCPANGRYGIILLQMSGLRWSPPVPPASPASRSDGRPSSPPRGKSTLRV